VQPQAPAAIRDGFVARRHAARCTRGRRQLANSFAKNWNRSGAKNLLPQDGFPKRVPMRFIAFLCFALLSTAVRAEIAITFPVSIPSECIELAVREGVPTVIQNKYEAAKARVKLARLKNEPIVQSCRQAVARARSEARYQ
jgi:hypothetical protein